MVAGSTYGHFLALKNVGTILLEYEGVCSHDEIVRLGQSLEQKLAPTAGSRFKKVFAVFIELIQNIKHYSALSVGNASQSAVERDGGKDGIGIVRIIEEDLCYTIIAGNPILSKDADRITMKCSSVKNTLTENLRTRYNEQIKLAQEETSKGAGVGFVDIAIKAGGNWEFEIQPIDEKYSFFVVIAYISKSKNADEVKL